MSRIKTKPKAWPRKEEAKLRKLYPVTNTRELAALLGREYSSVKTRASLLGLLKKNQRHKFTKKDDRLIRKLYPRTLTAAIAKRIGTTEGSVFRRALKLGVKKDPQFAREVQSELGRRLVNHPGFIANRFKKGQVSHNKGLRRPGYAPGRMASTQFKKGESRNKMPLGSERLIDGYRYRKISEVPNVAYTVNWKPCHFILWESVNGPIPKGHILKFVDGDRTNIKLDNLQLMTLGENMKRNTLHNLPAPLKEVLYLKGAISREINRRTRRIEREKQDQRSA